MILETEFNAEAGRYEVVAPKPKHDYSYWYSVRDQMNRDVQIFGSSIWLDGVRVDPVNFYRSK